jgi:hypothetical protein
VSRLKLLILLVAIAVACWVTALFVPGVYPYARYPLYYVRCGGPPVIASAFAADHVYRMPGSEGYEVHPFVTRYFCSSEEAEEAGYHPPAQ